MVIYVTGEENRQKNEYILEVKSLSVYFETPDKRVNILRNVNMKVKKGEVVGIVGESGSGKSTLAQAIIGVLDSPPAFIESGEIIFDGQRIFPQRSTFNYRGKGINMVFQEPIVSLNPVYTIRRQIEEAMDIAGIEKDKKIRENIITNTLRELMIRDVDRVLESYPHQLSGGMRQRVAIAISMLQRPKLIILDEPTTGLDLIVQRQIMKLLLNLKSEINTSMIIITHDLTVAANMCDRIYVMYTGSIVESGPRINIIGDPLHPYTLMLRNSVPTGYYDSGPLMVTEGSPPDISNLPPGCTFHPRCPRMMDICKEKVPQIRDMGNEREVACWLYE
ncbi:MAG: ABC transporter ATP-binding protein [Thermoplasmata archaeon]|jgi:oligopeptide/dipeptide ABC transporter ATP-binding protein|nr:ABC transporter ATP-binding protein [Euryarchaeota archaeon]